MKDDLISRQLAINAIEKKAYRHTYLDQIIDIVSELPSAQPKQTNCEYCHEDGDGYVTPLEKNCHALVRCSPIDGWILSVKYGAWRKDVPIRFCPMCGRRLTDG